MTPSTVAKYASKLTQPPNLPSRFDNSTTEDVRDIQIGQCTKEEVVVLATWLCVNTKIVSMDSLDFFDEEKHINKKEENMKTAEVIKREIESVDKNFLDNLADDYSDVGQLPVSIVDGIASATHSAEFELNHRLNLNAINIALGSDETTFKPDAFVAVFYEPIHNQLETDMTVVIFGSGDVFCFSNSKQDVQRGETLLRKKLEERDLI